MQGGALKHGYDTIAYGRGGLISSLPQVRPAGLGRHHLPDGSTTTIVSTGPGDYHQSQPTMIPPTHCSGLPTAVYPGHTLRRRDRHDTTKSLEPHGSGIFHQLGRVARHSSKKEMRPMILDTQRSPSALLQSLSGILGMTSTNVPSSQFMLSLLPPDRYPDAHAALRKILCCLNASISFNRPIRLN